MDKKELKNYLDEARKLVESNGSSNSYAFAFGFLESGVAAFLEGGEEDGKQKPTEK